MKEKLLSMVGLLVAVMPPAIARAQEQIVDVSLLELTSHAAQYDGKIVRVEGFLVKRFENSALYPGADDLTRRKAVWLGSATLGVVNRSRELAEHYVVLEGRFDSKSHGHMGKFAGTIVITKIEPDARKANVQEPPSPMSIFGCALPLRSSGESA